MTFTLVSSPFHAWGSPLSIDAFAGFASMLRMWFQSDQPVAVCRLCRTVNRDEARFCAGCGGKLPAFHAAASHSTHDQPIRASQWTECSANSRAFPSPGDANPEVGPDRGLHANRDNAAAQLVRRAEQWIRHADAHELLHVLLAGGLSANIVEDTGHFRSSVDLSERRDALSSLGIIWADLPADETLSIFAQVWGASAPPLPDDAREAWFAADAKAQQGARQWLRAEVAENITLFDRCVTEWCRLS
ncbi:hypothetical protein WKW77_33815 [Variovorax ureilyticus]|uniref:Zinc-ribbon domain-containing protein n=1 Tax=Variovorax ureilyticus TaxID=1836198 RepID=A0ABU8VRH0_9BURK